MNRLADPRHLPTCLCVMTEVWGHYFQALIAVRGSLFKGLVCYKTS